MSTLKVDTYLTRGGASEIAIDKLKGVTAVATINVVAEGGTVTTSLQQGLAKWWVNLQGHDTFGVTDSFNNTSGTDHGTGDYTCTMANDFAGAAQKSLTFGTFPSSDGGSTDPATNARGGTVAMQKPIGAQAAGTARLEIRKGSTGSADGGLVDISGVYLTGHGDLA